MALDELDKRIIGESRHGSNLACSPGIAPPGIDCPARPNCSRPARKKLPPLATAITRCCGPPMRLDLAAVDGRRRRYMSAPEWSEMERRRLRSLPPTLASGAYFLAFFVFLAADFRPLTADLTAFRFAFGG